MQQFLRFEKKQVEPFGSAFWQDCHTILLDRHQLHHSMCQQHRHCRCCLERYNLR